MSHLLIADWLWRREAIYYLLSPKKRDNEKANFRRLVKPFNVKNGTLYHGDVEAVTRDSSRNFETCFGGIQVFGKV